MRTIKLGTNNAKRTVKPAKPAAKAPVAAKPETVIAAPLTIVPAETKPNANEQRKLAAEAVRSSRITAHAAAANAVAAFYAGASKPFKASGDRFEALNFTNAKPGPNGLGTARQAALLLAMLTYSAGNIKADGTFIRGAFSVPAKLVFDAATIAKHGITGDTLLAAQPESGCLGNMLGRTVAFVDGPRSGAEQRNQTLRINLAVARNELRHFHGDSAASLIDAIDA